MLTPRLAVLALVTTLSTTAATAQTPLLHETFESGLGNWVASASPTLSRWHLVQEGGVCGTSIDPFPSSTNAARFGNASATPWCNFPGGHEGDLTLATPLSIPAGAQHVRLHYWSYEETECPENWWVSGNCAWDRRFVSVSTDGGANWIDVAFGGEERVWRQVSVDLSAFAGSDVLLRFRFDPLDAALNGYVGWVVDEIRVEYGVPGPVTYCKATVSGSTCTPALFHSGSTSLSGPDDLYVGASQIPNQAPSRILWSLSRSEHPFHGVTLCIAAPIARTPLGLSSGTALPQLDCSGTHRFHFSQQYLAEHFLSAGDTFYLQFSGRDPARPAPLNRSASAGLELTLLP